MVRWTTTSKDNVNNRFRVGTIDALSDGTEAYYTEYGVIKSNSTYEVTTFTSNIYANAISLWAIGNSGNVSVTFNRIMLGSSTTVGYMNAGPVGLTGPTGTISNTTGLIVTTNTTAATSTTTGALQVAGGAGIAGALYVGGIGNFTGNLITGHILPSANVTYDIGSPTLRFRTLYISGTTIDMGGAQITTDSASGGFAFVPKPTTANPNPLGTVFSPTGAITTINTTGGIIAAGAINTSINNNQGTANFGNARVNSETLSTSTTTGALQVAGGAGIAGNVYAGKIYTGGLYWSGNGNVIQTGGGTGSGITTTASATPPSTPSTGDVWYNTTTNVIYTYTNDGTSSFWLDTEGPSLAYNGNVTSLLITGTDVSTSTTTGALQVAGGTGIAGNLIVGGVASIGGNLTMSGSILPSANVAHALGSKTMQWKDLYVGPGSIYVNGQQVLSSSAGTIVISADADQNLTLQTSASGSLRLNPTGTGTIQLQGPVQITAGKNITSSDGGAIGFSNQIAVDSLTSKSTNTDLTITASGTGKVYVNDDMTVAGNLTISGTTTTVNTTTLSIADNLIDLNSDVTTGTPTENAGLRVLRGDSNAVQIRWTESSTDWQYTADGTNYYTFTDASRLTGSTLASGVTASSLTTVGNLVTLNVTGNVTAANLVITTGITYANGAAFSSGSGSGTAVGNSSIITNNQNITANATLNYGTNGFSVGPVNTANGITVTVTNGQRWVII
jgi:hypothetical protein